jgi:Domain of unknown function (DUF2017)
MKIKRKAGVLRVDLHANETSVLIMLLHDLNAVLDSDDAADPVLQRLYPDGYSDDAEAAAEFREMVAGTLREERTGRLAQCQAELPAGGGLMELDAEATDRWLRVLNDIRLALGTRLEVTDETEFDPSSEASNIYHWLGAVQESLVENAMRL